MQINWNTVLITGRTQIPDWLLQKVDEQPPFLPLSNTDSRNWEKLPYS